MTEQIHGPTSHIYFSQRLRLHYVDWGNPEAPPLLLVHGGRDHCRNWDWFAQEFRRDYHIIAPDLRGHGDSEWSVGGMYQLADYIYDIAQLIHQTRLSPVTIISHSLGANVSLHYAGLYPDTVQRVVAIEGMGRPPASGTEDTESAQTRLRNWVDNLRKLSGRVPRRYPTIEDAWGRMQAENPHLSPEQARHLTVHGVNQNEDGTYSWKFDNYVRPNPPFGLRSKDTAELWGCITCPTLLVRGTESWASDPVADGRIEHFQNARSVAFEAAGHWVHHDQLAAFVKEVRAFLATG